ncbi:hypothetical protein PGTUg99_019477 [Puccinia graminis f. sp. tritici]|uniref:Uncharacterized protein n=1 Tax=Puccinia graminis f. sp. tritici TaxID=56615 RepID=A0A5B0QL68_PUCGR|nr:hypothetical protein PGTUg99_019477 [Puccinia graminis f. sp. tritici]
MSPCKITLRIPSSNCLKTSSLSLLDDKNQVPAVFCNSPNQAPTKPYGTGTHLLAGTPRRNIIKYIDPWPAFRATASQAQLSLCHSGRVNHPHWCVDSSAGNVQIEELGGQLSRGPAPGCGVEMGKLWGNDVMDWITGGVPTTR